MKESSKVLNTENEFSDYRTGPTYQSLDQYPAPYWDDFVDIVRNIGPISGNIAAGFKRNPALVILGVPIALGFLGYGAAEDLTKRLVSMTQKLRIKYFRS